MDSMNDFVSAKERIGLSKHWKITNLFLTIINKLGVVNFMLIVCLCVIAFFLILIVFN